MSRFIGSTLLAFAGLGAALSVLAASLVLLAHSRRRGTPLLYLGVSGAYALSLAELLVRQDSGLACALVPRQGLLIYAALLILHLYFLLDLWRRLRETSS